MRISRRSLKSSLTQIAHTPVPEPDQAFVDRLESQLINDGATPSLPVENVIPLRTRAHRAVVIGVAAATLTSAAAAAALIVGTGDDSHRLITATEPTATGTATSTTTTSTTETPWTTTSLPTTTSTVADRVSTTIPTTTPAVQGNTPAPSTTFVDSTTTVPTPESTSTTEVHVPATLGIGCVLDGSNIRCTWTQGPVGTDHYLVLRSRPGGVDGRVFTPIAGQLTYADSQIVSGDSFNYLIHAFDAAGHSLAHSDVFPVAVP